MILRGAEPIFVFFFYGEQHCVGKRSLDNTVFPRFDHISLLG